MRTLRETYMDLIYMGSRKRQDLLSKLGARAPWERGEGEGRVREGSREKCGATGQWWRTPLIPTLGRQRQVDLCEFKASLVYKS